MTEPTHQPETSKIPLWLQASAADFDYVDINSPLMAATTVDGHEASSLFGTAAKASAEAQRECEERVYAMLGAICSFYFKPNEQAEPYGPMMRFAESRSAQPSDFSKPHAQMLASQIERVSHSGFRARLADLVWIVDRKQHVAAAAAITAYSEIVKGIINKSATLKRADADEHSYEVPQYLRRALQIGKAIGWDKDVVIAARQQVAQLRLSSLAANNHFSYRRFATLDLEYQISDSAEIAAEAERLGASTPGEQKHDLYSLAARAHRACKKQAERERCLLVAAEALVDVADAQRHSAMAETHWLEKAIAEMRRLPAAKDRLRALKHRLVDTQSRVLDEMQEFSSSQDITDLVEQARDHIRDKPLSEALRILALLSKSPEPQKLKDEARQAIAEHPLSSLFGATHYDHDGKPVHRTPGGGLGDGDEEAQEVREKIAQSEKLRRSIVVCGQIEPARQVILLEHAVDEALVALLCRHSGFVPEDREGIFVSGILHFLQGDMIAALHTLLPQIENSFRHILRLHGEDVVKINEDMTQEDMSLSQMVGRLRPALESIFGAAIIADIENLNIYRGGPQLRDRATHGLLHQYAPFGPDAVYACSLVFRLVCIPLLPHWDKLAPSLDS